MKTRLGIALRDNASFLGALQMKSIQLPESLGSNVELDIKVNVKSIDFLFSSVSVVFSLSFEEKSVNWLHLIFYSFQDERVTAAQALEHDWLKPFGGKPPPPDVPVEVLKRIYPDGNVPGREHLVNFASANGADVRQMDLDFEQEQCRSDLGSAEV
ncbi:hypothetical protein ANCCAN_05723 [Ancylostoma caninum]|uniref:Protein kinase domain-containing protein n=1 Tax=Ancylostoma caninum TaxID=29170 RepID=A0A368GX77_ANCCA|nr:hypothetical protein ANCCAN_05723 [Ancylostoma caninum]